MSQQNVEIVREAIEAWNRHDVDLGLRYLAADVEWVPASPAAVEGSVYRGHDEVAGGFAGIWDTWDEFRFDESEIRDLGDSVLWLGTAHMRGGTSKITLDQEFANHIVLSDGKIVRAQGFRSWQQAFDAVGLGD